MTGCKIGKIKMKNGGAEIRVIENKRTIFSNSVDALSYSIYSDTHAVGFFVLYKDGTVASGCTHDKGFTAMQLKGACEHMKDCLIDRIWGEE
jgi:hypothetical protein